MLIWKEFWNREPLFGAFFWMLGQLISFLTMDQFSKSFLFLVLPENEVPWQNIDLKTDCDGLSFANPYQLFGSKDNFLLCMRKFQTGSIVYLVLEKQLEL